MKYLMIFIILFLFACASDNHKTLCNSTTQLVYNMDGFKYTEDLFVCYLYPSMLSVIVRSNDKLGAISMAEYYGKEDNVKFDYVDCELIK